MSIKLMSQVWESDLPSEQKYTLLALADYANDDGENVYPSVGTLARKTSLSPRTVQRHLRALEADGLIEAHAEARQHRPTTYRIRGDRLSPLPARGDMHVVPGVTSTTPRGDTVSPESSVEPPVEPSVRPKPLRVRARDEIWDALVQLYGEPQDPRLRGSMNLACKELKAQHATPETMRDRYELAPLADLGWAVVTPLALAKHWGLRLQDSLRSHSVADTLLRGAQLLEGKRGADRGDEADGEAPRSLPRKSSRPRDG